MSENINDDQPDDISSNESIELQSAAVTSPYKVLGQLDADNGVGVLGQNDANSGTPYGVAGAVPNASNGYGLYTADDAKIEGTIAVSTLGGPLTGGTGITDLLGSGLAVSSGALSIASGGVTSSMLADGTIDVADLGQNGASDGQSFVWDSGTGSWTTADVSGSSKWADSDSNSLLEPSGTETGIEVTDIRTDTLSDNGSGALSVGTRVDLDGNDLADSGTTIWDTSSGYIPQGRLQNDSITVAGNPVSLGGSVGVGHGDLANISSSDHHTRPTAGDGLTDDTNTFNVEPADFVGTTLEDAGSNTLEVAPDSIGTSELAVPFGTLSDLFGLTVTAGAPIEASDIETSNGNILRFDVYGRALAMVAGGYDIPSEGGGISAPNVVAGAHNSTGGASPRGAVVGGGGSEEAPNEASENFATVCGGEGNVASDYYATVLGGDQNTASAFNAVAAGSRAAAEDSDSFVFNDGTGYHSIPNASLDGLSSSLAVNGEPATGINTFSVSAGGGVRFITGSSEVVYTTDGSAGWSMTSTQSAKTNFEGVNPGDVLEGVEEMAITTWEYQDDDGAGKGVKHIGPTAEAFHKVIDVGDSEEHINSVNADGVAFAAIQGLADRLDDARAELNDRGDRVAELETETEELREENERLRERNAELEARLDRLESAVGINDPDARGVADD